MSDELIRKRTPEEAAMHFTEQIIALRNKLAAAEARATRMEGALRRIVTEADSMPKCPPPDHACPVCEILFVATEALAADPQAMRSGEEMQEACLEIIADVALERLKMSDWSGQSAALKCAELIGGIPLTH